jgi:hypothetical protein
MIRAQRPSAQTPDRLNSRASRCIFASVAVICRRTGRLLCSPNHNRRSLGSWPDSTTHEILHFLHGNKAIFVGIHSVEDWLVSRLKLLHESFPSPSASIRLKIIRIIKGANPPEP